MQRPATPRIVGPTGRLRLPMRQPWFAVAALRSGSEAVSKRAVAENTRSWRRAT
jgi:hypothetical protein